MSDNILARYSRSLADRSVLTPLQVQVDETVGRFVEDATDPRFLASMTAGGLAYRVGKLGVMGLGSSAVFRPLSVAVGLGSEVTTFEFTNRLLHTFRATGQSPLQDSTPVTRHLSLNLWSWSGSGGWKEGLTTSLISFGMLKGAGLLAREQNLVLQHAFQSAAMVGGHNAAGVLGLTPRPEGSLADQLWKAEATNLQMGAAMTLGHSLSGGRLLALERGLDLSLSFRSAGTPFVWPRAGGPLLAMETAGGRGGIGTPFSEVRVQASRPVLMSAENTTGGEALEAHRLIIKMSSGLHVRPSRLVGELLHHYPEVQLTVQRKGSIDEPVAVNPQSVLDLLEMGVSAGEEMIWRVEGEKGEEVLAALRYYNENHWRAAVEDPEAVSIRRIPVEKPRRIAASVSHAMDELKTELLSGVYHNPTETLVVGKIESDHASIAQRAGFVSILDVTRVVLERTGSLIKMIFPPDESHLENAGGQFALKQKFPELFEGVDLKRQAHRLIAITSREDIPLSYRQTAIGRLLEYHNLQRPFGTYASATCLIGLCMDNRKMLRLPDRFAFVLRAAGANLHHNEFDLSVAVALGNLSTMALIGHTNCKAVDLQTRKQAYVEGLVRNAGWDAQRAEDYFTEQAPHFEMRNEIDFLLKESQRLRGLFPKLHIVPLLYRVEDNRLYLLREDSPSPGGHLSR